MTDIERTKFIRHLQKTMKTSESATERMAATRLYAQMMGIDGDTAGTGDITLPALPVKLEKRTPTEFSEACAFAMREHPDQGLGCLLHLVQPPRWMAGLWANIPNGWRDCRTHTDLSFDEARVMVADRIAELGLNADKVWSYPHTPSPWKDEQVFRMLPFEQQLERFRTGE